MSNLLPGSFYKVSFHKEYVIKKRRDSVGLLLLNFFFIDPSLTNLRKIVFSPRQKLKEIEKVFENEQKVLKQVPEYIIGNVEFLPDGYKQNKVVIFSDLSRTNEEYILNFKKWIEANYELWKYGYWDTSLNFDINSGFTHEGKCILFDVNEFTDNYETAISEIRSKKWHRQHAFKWFRFIGNQELRREILRIADELFTEGKLKSLWKTMIK